MALTISIQKNILNFKCMHIEIEDTVVQVYTQEHILKRFGSYQNQYFLLVKIYTTDIARITPAAPSTHTILILNDSARSVVSR